MNTASYKCAYQKNGPLYNLWIPAPYLLTLRCLQFQSNDCGQKPEHLHWIPDDCSWWPLPEESCWWLLSATNHITLLADSLFHQHRMYLAHRNEKSPGLLPLGSRKNTTPSCCRRFLQHFTDEPNSTCCFPWLSCNNWAFQSQTSDQHVTINDWKSSSAGRSRCSSSL